MPFRQMAASAATRLKSVSMWNNLSVGHFSIRQWIEGKLLYNHPVHFYSNGSKLEGNVGFGVFSDQLNIKIAFRLPDFCSIFQAEVVAINEVVNWLRHYMISATDILIFTDSQVAIKSLRSVSCKSKVVRECQLSLNEMAEQFHIQLICVPGHAGIPENCTADELAKQGKTLQILPER